MGIRSFEIVKWQNSQAEFQQIAFFRRLRALFTRVFQEPVSERRIILAKLFDIDKEWSHLEMGSRVKHYRTFVDNGRKVLFSEKMAEYTLNAFALSISL